MVKRKNPHGLADNFFLALVRLLGIPFRQLGKLSVQAQVGGIKDVALVRKGAIARPVIFSLREQREISDSLEERLYVGFDTLVLLTAARLKLNSLTERTT